MVGVAVSDSETVSVIDREPLWVTVIMSDSVAVRSPVSDAVTVGVRYITVLLDVTLTSTVAVLDTVQSELLLLDPRLRDLSSVMVTVSVAVKVRVS